MLSHGTDIEEKRRKRRIIIRQQGGGIINYTSTLRKKEEKKTSGKQHGISQKKNKVGGENPGVTHFPMKTTLKI